MGGMLQILTYLLCFYLVIKGIEVLQIALASSRDRRGPMITLGALTLIACVGASYVVVTMQDSQDSSLSNSMSRVGT
jgi:hypothetical protein